MKSKRQSTDALGRKLQRLARDYYHQLGYRVDIAEKKVRWFPVNGRVVPRSFDHDFFGCWDLIVVRKQRRFFVQVTTLAHVANKRAKIRDLGFPCSRYDVILGWVKGRKFRVCYGPDFKLTDEIVESPKPAPKPSMAEERREFSEVASYG